MQLASKGVTYICNTAFTARNRLQHRHSAFPSVSLKLAHEAASLNGGQQLHLQGLPAESLYKARHAWQKLLVERLQYLQ